jgi:lipoprotein-releasing system ATP-binding protein
MNEAIVTCQQVRKAYHDGNLSVDVLHGIHLTVEPGERVAIVGPSGSGKSTLLHLLGGLDKPSSGHIFLKDKDWQTLNEKTRCQFRNKHLGFIYQFHHLLPEFSALENVAMPLLLGHMAVKPALSMASEILTQVGLQARLDHRPAQLSGGERQRVAIARALVHKPACVLADEPTGNLDQTTAAKVFDLMLDLNTQLQTALIVVTHDLSLANRMDRIMTLQDGGLI